MYVLKSEIDTVKDYYSKDVNYTWSVQVADSENENLYTKDLTLTDSEIEYLYNMANMERNETIFFEEIDKKTFLNKLKDLHIGEWRKNYDSRKFGCVPFEKIEGKVVLRFWPLNVFGKVQ